MKSGQVRSDYCERLVDTLDLGVCEVLADEFKFFFVQERCLQRYRELAADERHDLSSNVLEGKGSRRVWWCRYFKGHRILRLATPAPEKSGGGQQDGLI
jgi:hypothetical protein